MSRVQWQSVGERFYETGIDRGVLYVGSNPGVAWNGLTSVVESPTGGDPQRYYRDGVNYLNVSSTEEYEATLSAFYSPEEFDVCDGAVEVGSGFIALHQPRQQFGLSYRTKIGNDLAGSDYGYKIHLVYNALAAPAEHNYETLSNDVSVEPLSWKLVAKPVAVPGAAPTAHFVIDTTKFPSWVIDSLESILYGTDEDDARLPSPEEIITIIDVNSYFALNTYPGGIFTLSAADSLVTIEDEQWSVIMDSLAAHYVDSDTYVFDLPDQNAIESAGVDLTASSLVIFDTFHRFGEIIGSKYANNGKLWTGTSGAFTMNGDQLVNDQATYGMVQYDAAQKNGKITVDLDLVTSASPLTQQLKFYQASHVSGELNQVYAGAFIPTTGIVGITFYYKIAGTIIWSQALTSTQKTNIGLLDNTATEQRVTITVTVNNLNLTFTAKGPNGVTETVTRTMLQTEYDALGTYVGMINAAATTNPGIKIASFKAERL